MRFISLFSGIGGLDLGLEWAGWQCVAQVEKDEYCRRVLAKHWPDVPRFEDVRDVGKHNLPPADAIVGGFPCQPHSYAGKRRGAADDRNLWPEYYRIVTELRPTWVIGENVPGLRTTILDDIISDLEGAEYSVATFDIPAIAFDARHIRHRLFIVAHRNGAGQRKQRRPVSVPPQQLAAQRGRADLGDTAAAGQQNRVQSPMGGPKAQSKFERPSRAGEPRSTEPGVGGTADGVPSRLDGFGLDETPESYWSGDWERSVPRVVGGGVKIKNRVSRIRGLGNAVVPQVAEFVGRMILEASPTLVNDRQN